MHYKSLVQSALGHIPFDMVIKNVKLVNVFTGEIHDASIGIKDKHIAYVGDGKEELSANEYIDGRGRFAIPGLVDAHMHIESSMVTPYAFAEGVLPHGTTAVATDPHEIANVLGIDGIRMMIEASKDLPLKIYTLASTCVPSLPGMETAGGNIGPKEMAELLDEGEVIGLAEVMDFWGVVNLDEKITGILEEARKRDALIEGHCPVFSGKNLQAFIAAGVDSDHTLMTLDKVVEKLRLGMTVQIQEKSICPEIIQYLNTLPDPSNFMFVTDDVMADRLVYEGHLDHLIRKAIGYGLDPIKAVQAATIRPARRLRLFKHGSIGPGHIADIILLDSLKEFIVSTVIADGQVVAKDGKMVADIKYDKFPERAYHTVKLSSISRDEFTIKTSKETGMAKVAAIAVNPINTETQREDVDVPIVGGKLDLEGTDLSMIAVFERHGVRGSKNLGLVKGLGITQGAIATTYAHDSHNLVIIGNNKDDMALAANTLIQSGGGMVATQNGKVLSHIALPIAGLLSDKKMADVAKELSHLRQTLEDMGIEHKKPIMMLATLTLPVAPHLKITDLGLVDVVEKQFINLIISEK